VAASSGCALAQSNGDVRINQIQIIGTHNSYHSGFAPSAAKLWQQKNPKVFAGLDYRHPSLTTQFDGGVRQIELDIFADTKGGLYAHPYGETLIAQAGLPADPPFDPQHLMEKPGFKVMHVQDVDYRSVLPAIYSVPGGGARLVSGASATFTDLYSGRDKAGSAPRKLPHRYTRDIHTGNLRCAGPRNHFCLSCRRDHQAR
jgi:hypothetical protein